MMIVRSARMADLPALMALAEHTGPGFTTLKPDEALLGARLARTERTLADTATRAEAGYLFVMEDTATGQAVGTSGIDVEVGLEQPFYTYRLDTVVHASRELGVWTRMQTLTLSNDLTGYSELCTLFLHLAYRHSKLGSVLSKSRFMFLAQFADRFPRRLCAEMRGYFDESGRSPFWDALGAHFFRIEFERADYLVSMGQKAFIAELMPKHPVYVDFLPKAAQEAIGKTHPETTPARKLLEQEGMRLENYVDIFEAGPVLEAWVADLRASRDSRLVSARIDAAAEASGRPHLVCNTALLDFRVALATGEPANGGFALRPETADALQVAAGEPVRILPLSSRSQ